ncbi:MAG: cytidine deaminase [Clostridia bacterium]|nr:cytidine deaminase [Clostridia bacterium]
MERLCKNNYYLGIAETVAVNSTCLRRAFGAVIVKNDEIISTGYNGAPRGRKNCTDLCFCMREKLNIPRGQRYELCRSVHAESNAIISASRQEMLGATLYLTGIEVETGEYVKNSCCCAMCKRLVINSGIKEVVIRDDKENFRVIDVQEWIDNDESLEEITGY